jgi:hypothetical protein
MGGGELTVVPICVSLVDPRPSEEQSWASDTGGNAYAHEDAGADHGADAHHGGTEYADLAPQLSDSGSLSHRCVLPCF